MEAAKLHKIPRPDSDLPPTDRPVIRPTVERVMSSRKSDTRSSSIDFDNTVLMNMGEGMYTVDVNGCVTSMNHTAEILFQRTFDEMIGRRMHDVTHYKHRDGRAFPAKECSEFKVLRNGKALKNYEDAFIRADGTFFDVIYSSSPIRENGAIAGLVVVFRDVTEHNQTLAALRESEERYRILTETASDAIIRIDAGSTIQFVNSAAMRIFGYSEAEMTGQSLTMLMPEQLREQHRKEIARYLATGKQKLTGMEIPARHKDGHEFPLEISFGEYNQDGNRFFIGVARDITERKRGDEALHERMRLAALRGDINAALISGETLPAVLQNCAAALVKHLDAAFARVWTLNEAENVLEMQASAGIYTHRDGPHGRVKVGEFKIGRIAQSRQPLLTNDVLHDANISDPEWAKLQGMVAFAGYPLLLENRLLGVMAIFARHPLSETVLDELAPIADGIAQWIQRKAAEEALRESETNLHNLADTIPQLAWMAEPDGNIFWYNRGWQEYTGKTLEEMQGWGWESVHDPKILPKVLEHWKFSLATAEPFEMEFPLKGADGTFRWFLTRVNPLRDTGERIVRWFGTNTDITEQRQTRLNAEFLASVTDDLTQIADSDEMLRSVAAQIGTYMDLSACAFVHIDETRDTATVSQCWHRPGVPDLVGVYPLSDYLADEFQKEVRAGKSFVICDTAADPRITKPESYSPLKIRSFVVAPAVKSGEWRFSVAMYDSSPRDWRSDEIDLARLLTDRIWTRLERDLAEEKERVYARQLAVITRSSQKLILSEQPLAEMLKDIFTDVAETVETEMFFHYVAGDEPGLMDLTNWGGITKDERDFFAHMKFGEHFCGRVAERRERMIVEDLAINEFPGGEVLRAAGVKAYAGFPLIAQGQLIGTIAFVTHARTKFSEGELLTIQTVCDHVAVTLDRLYAEEKFLELYHRTEEQSRIFDTTLSSITDFAYIFDREGRFLYSNRPLLDLLGITLEEIIGKNFFDLNYPPDLATRLQSQIQQVIESKEIIADDTPFTNPEGKLGFYEYIFSPVIAVDGSVDLVAGSTRDITERKRIEEELRESESRFSLAQEAGNVGVWDWEVAADRTYWSETMWRIYDAKPQDINPDEAFWLSHIHDNDRDRAKLTIQERLASTHDRHSDVFRIIQKSGDVKWIESIATIQRDESGKPVRMYGVDIDITAKKNIEERIRRSEDQLRIITNSVPGLISYIDREHRYRFVNHQYTEWFGKPESEIIGKHIRDLLGVKTYKILKPKIEQVLAGEACSIETLVHYQMAGDRFVQFSYTPDFSDDGAVKGFYVLVTDLTERKRAEDLLRTSEERMRVLMNSLTEHAVLSLDVKGRIDAWNRGAQLLFGYKPEEIMGSPVEKLFTPDDVRQGVHLREMRLSREKGHAADDRWHIRKDGTRFFASGEMTPVYVGNSLIGYAKIVRDLTETKRMADELQRANNELEARVSDRTQKLAEANALLLLQMDERAVANDQRTRLLRRLFTVQEDERGRIARDIHDQLGQSLTALRLKIASLKDISADDPVVTERINRLQEIAEHLDTDVSFLAWELRPSVLDDVEFVRALGNYVTEWSRRSDIFAEFDTVGLTGVKLDADIENNLYRITQESLNNAAKHARADRINVVLEKRGDFVMLIIEDNGAGFDPDLISEERGKGGGFGLFGMRERASLISGTIEIESSPNKGTSVFVRVPLG